MQQNVVFADIYNNRHSSLEQPHPLHQMLSCLFITVIYTVRLYFHNSGYKAYLLYMRYSIFRWKTWTLFFIHEISAPFFSVCVRCSFLSQPLYRVPPFGNFLKLLTTGMFFHYRVRVKGYGISKVIKAKERKGYVKQRFSLFTMAYCRKV